MTRLQIISFGSKFEILVVEIEVCDPDPPQPPARDLHATCILGNHPSNALPLAQVLKHNSSKLVKAIIHRL